jgi:hypothetical protein
VAGLVPAFFGEGLHAFKPLHICGSNLFPVAADAVEKFNGARKSYNLPHSLLPRPLTPTRVVPTCLHMLADLMKLARRLHEQSPKRTCPVLGPDGRPKTFSKKPFAADFKDNPAGGSPGLECQPAS